MVTGNSDPFAWQQYALCRETDPDEFFPPEKRMARTAKAVCRRCEVRPECLEFALAHNEEYGIWAGLTYRERQVIVSRRQRRKKAAA